MEIGLKERVIGKTEDVNQKHTTTLKQRELELYDGQHSKQSTKRNGKRITRKKGAYPSRF